MALKEYAFKYGRGEIRFPLDPTQVKGELRIKDFPPLPANFGSKIFLLFRHRKPPFWKPSAVRSVPNPSAKS